MDGDLNFSTVVAEEAGIRKSDYLDFVECKPNGETVSMIHHHCHLIRDIHRLRTNQAKM
jgi:uncharacterized protein involved in high-affinity Fe2+ transport